MESNELNIGYDLSGVSKDFARTIIDATTKKVNHPITNAIITYCKLTGLNNILSDNECEEFMFRVSILNSIGILVYQRDDDGNVNVFEPLFLDVRKHIGLIVDCEYIPTKKFILNYLDDTITFYREKSIAMKNKVPFNDFYELRQNTLNEMFGINSQNNKSVEPEVSTENKTNPDNTDTNNTTETAPIPEVKNNGNSLQVTLKDGSIVYASSVDELVKVLSTMVEPNDPLLKGLKISNTKVVKPKVDKVLKNKSDKNIVDKIVKKKVIRK